MISYLKHSAAAELNAACPCLCNMAGSKAPPTVNNTARVFYNSEQYDVHVISVYCLEPCNGAHIAVLYRSDREQHSGTYKPILSC